MFTAGVEQRRGLAGEIVGAGVPAAFVNAEEARRAVGQHLAATAKQLAVLAHKPVPLPPGGVTRGEASMLLGRVLQEPEGGWQERERAWCKAERNRSEREETACSGHTSATCCGRGWPSAG